MNTACRRTAAAVNECVLDWCRGEKSKIPANGDEKDPTEI